MDCHFQKEKQKLLLYLLVNCMCCGFFMCFLVQILLLYLPVNCAEGEQYIWAIQVCFSSTCFLVQNCPWFSAFAWLNKFGF